jgi:photosystem II stability/assembly factor-like uncharacterized protein
LIVLCAVMVIAAVAFVAWSHRPVTLQPYGGAATANDELIRVTVDPSGGVWAIGLRYDRDPSASGARLLSTLIIHGEQGHWVIAKSFDAINDVSITDLAMVSPTEGWAVGSVFGSNAYGVILHYQDGGWSEESFHPRGMLTAIAMVSPTEGWAVGGDPQPNGAATILHYSDGGWAPVDLQAPITGQLAAISMTSADAGWAAGTTSTPANDFSLILLRYDQGQWSSAPAPSGSGTSASDQPDVVAALAAPAPDDVWAVGLEFRHFARGAWSSAPNPAGVLLSDIAMSSAMDGWAVGDPIQWHTAVILHYAGGAWTQVDSPTQQPLSSVAMLSPSDGWAVGARGTILHYAGGGWSIINGG